VFAALLGQLHVLCLDDFSTTVQIRRFHIVIQVYEACTG
jgi:hypothetical protein